MSRILTKGRSIPTVPTIPTEYVVRRKGGKYVLVPVDRDGRDGRDGGSAGGAR